MEEGSISVEHVSGKEQIKGRHLNESTFKGKVCGAEKLGWSSKSGRHKVKLRGRMLDVILTLSKVCLEIWIEMEGIW